MMKKQKLQIEIEKLSQDVIGLIFLIKNDYDDIIKEILPNDLLNTYEFKKANDIRYVKNYLKKTFARIGIHIEDSK
jgi:hypothetical protein